MLKLSRVTKVKVLFLVLVFVFNFDLFKFSAAILEKCLFFEPRAIKGPTLEGFEIILTNVERLKSNHVTQQF